MKIKGVKARAVLDSRKQKTIQVEVKTSMFNKFVTSAPSGKSTGKFEIKPYAQSLEQDIQFINSLNLKDIELSVFGDLIKIEQLVGNNLGANSLYALEASILKALANENKVPLYRFLGGIKIPRPIGNAIGGGFHSKGIQDKKPDFQEFLFIPASKTIKKCVQINKLAYNSIGNLSKMKKRNDEGAWETYFDNETVLQLMKKAKDMIHDRYEERIEIGLDVAASCFFNNNYYKYKNKAKKLDKVKQIQYINNLIKKHKIYYVEDGLEENDFSGFNRLKGALIVGDDLTTTNPKRFERAIKMKSINAIIVKPNQIGSLLKVKQVIDIAKKNNIKTIISHRSGETLDNTIADLGVGFNCDFIKTGIFGKVRESKLNRLVEIEKSMKK
tara:strand:- start:388 stop:1542 length:1155 start_codon:yes stop_codon:yes gene_type:complete